MKKTVAITLLYLSFALHGLADFKMPKNVYRMNQLDAAKAEAQAQEKAIAFVLTQEKTPSAGCAAASLNVVRELKNKTVVVYVNCDNEFPMLPQIVQEALRKPEVGRSVPITVIVDPQITNVIAIVPCAVGAEQQKLFKEAKKKISKAMPKDSAEKRPLTSPKKSVVLTIQPDTNREIRTWKTQSGTEVRASLVKESGPYVVLKKEDGAEASFLLSGLSKEDQEYVAKLKESLQKDVQSPPEPNK